MSFTSQNKALLLLITDSSVQLLSWKQNTLAWLDEFHNPPEDLDVFGEAIRPYRGWPVILLADVIEESFRHDTIVHVTGGDRAALLKRKLEFAFRGTPYRLAKVTGRTQQGRRDDRILLSAITKPDLLAPWVGVLLEQKFAIQSISSVAHLLHAFAAVDKLEKEPNLLIINLEQGNNLRQTFIREGQVLFSRLTTLTATGARQLGAAIHHETRQIRQYFERNEFLVYNAPLRIRVYAAHDEQSLQLEARATDSDLFEVFDVRPLLAALPVDLQDRAPVPVYYFLAKVLARLRPENSYAPPASSKYHDLGNIARLVSITAGVLLLLGLAINAPVALGVLDMWQQRDVLAARTRPLQGEYALLSQRFPATPIPSREMELVVETFDVIKRQIRTPVDTLNLISAALAQAPGLELTAVSWALEEKTSVPVADEYGTLPLPRTPPAGQNATSAFMALVLQEKTALKVQISGQAYLPSSFREAQNQVETFVDALAANPGVTVFASKMPTDVRTDIRVSTTVTDGEVSAPFMLDLTLDLAAEAPAP
jgi:hypothetical protein